MHQLSKFTFIVLILSLVAAFSSCTQSKDKSLKEDQPAKVRIVTKEVKIQREDDSQKYDAYLKNDAYWKSDAYRLYYRTPETKNYRSHPATVGLFLSIIRDRYVCGESCENGLKYPYIDKNKTVHIYKDAKLKEIIGSIEITRQSEEFSTGLYYYNDVKVKINNQIKCHFKENPQFSWTEYDSDGFPEDEKKEYCFPLHIFNAMLEVNRIHPNSYEIFQGDGTSLFIDKKEIDPLVFVRSISTYDKLKEFGYKGKDIKAIFEALQVAIDEVRNSSFEDYSSKYHITSFGADNSFELFYMKDNLKRQFDILKSDINKHALSLYDYRVHVRGDKLLFFSGVPLGLLLNETGGDDSGYMFGSAFSIIPNKDKKFVPSGHVVFYKSR